MNDLSASKMRTALRNLHRRITGDKWRRPDTEIDAEIEKGKAFMEACTAPSEQLEATHPQPSPARCEEPYHAQLREMLRQKLMSGYPLSGEPLEVVLDALMVYEQTLIARHEGRA